MTAARNSVTDSDAGGTVLALALGEGVGPAPWRRAALEAVANLELPDCWIAAGFARSPVWDWLHGFDAPTPLGDIDVVYFDPAHPEPEADAALEARLSALVPGLPWQVRNQARMHLGNGDPPYRSTGDALTHWLETATAVAVRLEPGDDQSMRPALLAPCGLDDLFGLVIRPTPKTLARPQRMAAFHERLAAKDWQTTWPKLRVKLQRSAEENR